MRIVKDKSFHPSVQFIAAKAAKYIQYEEEKNTNPRQSSEKFSGGIPEDLPHFLSEDVAGHDHDHDGNNEDEDDENGNKEEDGEDEADTKYMMKTMMVASGVQNFSSFCG